MMDNSANTDSPGANNSGDFVRTLYQMVEDPACDSVRWGADGKSLVVLENKFTTQILPKYFNNCKFASFVRQLNKYDFRKVRENNEDNSPSLYDPNEWEFIHPKFQANNKDSLDNIRRKVSVPRNPTQTLQESFPSQQMDLANSQLMAIQHQLQQLSEIDQKLAQSQVALQQDVTQMEEFVENHNKVVDCVDTQMRKSCIGGPFSASTLGTHVGDPIAAGPSDYHPASPLYGWGVAKPRILLVEDDKICACIGSKILQAFGCGVETACDGLEAVSKINNPDNHFDLILMDIIMPHLDGVSATVCIREVRPNIPIIAMTSNIQASDIDMYFRYGMNDVLPKPFTKDSMICSLGKHLSQFKRNAQLPTSTQLFDPSGFVTTSQPNTPSAIMNMGQLPPTQTIKDERSPGKSPVTAAWNSSNQIPGPWSIIGIPRANFIQPIKESGSYPVSSPLSHNPQAQAVIAGRNATPTATPRGQRRKVLSEMVGSTGPKRQQIYPPQTNFAQINTESHLL